MYQPEQLAFDVPGHPTQRWNRRRHTFPATTAGGFDKSRYDVRSMEARAARAFIETHHYSGSWPSVSLPLGMFDRDSPLAGGRLVGVLTLGVPTTKRTLTRPFPWLVPYYESLELNRFVLLDEVPANAESWCIGQSMAIAERRGVRAVIAHSDPQPRWRRTEDGGREKIFRGHIGTIYQATNMSFIGLTCRRRVWLLPDGTEIPGRTLTKIRKQERGSAAAEAALVRRGARPRGPRELAREWLVDALAAVGAVLVSHSGKYRYALQLGPHRLHRPLENETAFPYPRLPEGLPQ